MAVTLVTSRFAKYKLGFIQSSSAPNLQAPDSEAPGGSREEIEVYRFADY